MTNTDRLPGLGSIVRFTRDGREQIGYITRRGSGAVRVCTKPGTYVTVTDFTVA